MQLRAHLILAVGFFGVALSFAARTAAAQDGCEQITVANCPTFFKEDCSDPKFRSENVDACFNIITDAAVDQPICSESAIQRCVPKEECEKMDDPLDHHFCLAGQSQCKKTVPELLAEYDVVLKGLQGALSDYDSLTKLDLGDASSIEKLCGYKVAELDRLQGEAETQLTNFSSSEDSIGSVDQCASTLQSFIDAGAPEDFPQETWDEIAKVMNAGMQNVQIMQGQIESSIEALKVAPKKLRSLKTGYRLICPQPEE